MDNNHNFLWGYKFGGSNRDNLDALAIDQNDDIITTGLYQSSNGDFDPGAGVANLSFVDESDVFVQKLDAQGNFLWAKAASGDDFQESYSIDTDVLGNIYVAGFAALEIAYDYPNNSVMTPVTGSRDGFLWKLNPNGNTSWFKLMAGNFSDNLYDVYVANDSKIFVSGAGSDSLNYSDTQNPVYFDTNSNGFLAEYDSLGSFQFRYELSQSYSAAKQVIARGDEVFMAGEFSSTVDFDWSVSQVNDLSSYFILDYFLLNIGPAAQPQPSEIIDYNNLKKDLVVYPNPVERGKRVQVRYPENYVSFTLLTLQGKRVRQNTTGSFSTADLTSGIYVIQAEGEQHNAVHKLVVR